MNTILIGAMIKKRRLELGITQEQLCEGICEPPSLSKIENGKQKPSKEKLDALMQRMGISNTFYYSLTSQKEYNIYTLKYQIVEHNINNETEEITNLLQCLKQLIEPDDKINQQFILRIEAAIGFAQKKDPNEILQLLYDAILLTHPLFEEKKLNQFLFSFGEIKIINHIAVIKFDLGMSFHSIRILYNLLDYIEEAWFDIEERVKIYPLIAYNLSKHLGKEKQYKEAIAVIDKAIAICRHCDQSPMITQLIFNKGYCLNNLDQAEESIDCIKQAYYSSKLLGKEKLMEQIKHYAKIHLNFSLDE